MEPRSPIRQSQVHERVQERERDLLILLDLVAPVLVIGDDIVVAVVAVVVVVVAVVVVDVVIVVV